jgi:hypothetical protein
MKPLAYSSMEAFLAHYRILREASRSDGDGRALSDSERGALAEMERLTQSLTPAERDALFESAPDGEGARRRHRAEFKLRRILTARGILQG